MLWTSRWELLSLRQQLFIQSSRPDPRIYCPCHLRHQCCQNCQHHWLYQPRHMVFILAPIFPPSSQNGYRVLIFSRWNEETPNKYSFFKMKKTQKVQALNDQKLISGLQKCRPRRFLYRPNVPLFITDLSIVWKSSRYFNRILTFCNM